MAAGKQMYVDMVEFKPPGSFAAWMLIHQTIGSEPPQVFAVAYFVSVMTMLAIYRCAAGLSGSRAAGCWAAVFWALVNGERFIQGNQPNIEVFMNLFLAWGVAVLVPRPGEVSETGEAPPLPWWRFVIAGWLLSCATLQKHHTITTVGLLGIAWLIGGYLSRAPRRWRKAVGGFAIVGATVLICWGAVVGYFAATGRLQPFILQIVTYAMHYSTSGGGIEDAAKGSLLTNLTKPFTDSTYLFPHELIYMAPLLALALAAVVWAIYVRSVRARGLILLAWLVGTYLTVSLPGTYYPHYFQLWLAPICVGAGWATIVVAGWLGRPGAHRLVGAAAAVFALMFVLPEYAGDGDAWSIKKYGNGFIHVRAFGKIAGEVVPPGETFFEIGTDPGLFYYAHRLPSSGIFWAHRTLVGPFRKEWTAKVMADLNATKPNLIVLDTLCPPPPHHPFLKFLRENNFIIVENHPMLRDEQESMKGRRQQFIFVVRKDSTVWENLRAAALRAKGASTFPTTSPASAPSSP
jgi:hypothetical protein